MANSNRNSMVLATINFITLALSIPVLVTGIWLATRHQADCLGFLQWPTIVIGIVMLVTSLIGLVGTVQRAPTLLWIYMVLLFLIILLLLAFTVFAFVVTHKGGGHKVSGAKFKEYRLNDFSDWLQDQVNTASNWEKVKRCIQDRQVCGHLAVDYPNQGDFYHAKLSPVESGCCKPPTSCGFHFVKATTWVSATHPNADADCRSWSNVSGRLCYGCNSCRAGALQTVRKDWKKAAKIDITVLVLLVIVYSMAWKAFTNAKREARFRQGGGRGRA